MSGWEWRQKKKLRVIAPDGRVISEGQNAVLGVVDPTWFKRPKTALRGVTSKSQARARLGDSALSWRRRAKRRAKLLLRAFLREASLRESRGSKGS